MIDLRLTDAQAGALNNALRREMAIIQKQTKEGTSDFDRTEYLRLLDECRQVIVAAVAQ